MRDGVPKLKEGQSAVFQALPGYPLLDPARALSLQKNLRELSAFQAEVIAAREAPAEQQKARVLALRDCGLAGDGVLQRAVTLELLYLLRDCVDWQSTRAFIGAIEGR